MSLVHNIKQNLSSSTNNKPNNFSSTLWPSIAMFYLLSPEAGVEEIKKFAFDNKIEEELVIL